jgi:protein phosphatase-4 regulatory subunit 3
LHVVISCFPFTYSIPKGILHTPVDDGRFRRDPRALDEDEELWFEGEDELENIDPSNSLVPPLTPPISLSGKNKLVLECELKPELSPGLDSSPPSSHVGTPRPTRADMELFKPLSKSSSPPPPTLKPFKGLVDYDDEDDSEEEEQTGNSLSSNNVATTASKKPKVEEDVNSPILSEDSTTEDQES